MKKAQDGVQAAIQKQKEKRAAIQAASDARKEKAMAPRRAKGLPATPKTGKTTLPAGEGSMKKYMNAGTNPFGSTKGPVKVGGKPDAPAPKKTSGAGGGKKKVVRTASAAIAAPKREMPSGMSKPSAPGVSGKPATRELSKTESKMAAEIQKMRSGKTSTEAGQARIKALKAKDAMSKQRAMRKEKRAAVKAVKQSYKK
jgi:hypothetical protein